MSATYKRMEKVLMQHLDSLQQACSGPSPDAPAPVPKALPSTSTSPTLDIIARKNQNLTPEATEEELRLQSSPFGVKNLLMASAKKFCV